MIRVIETPEPPKDGPEWRTQTGLIGEAAASADNERQYAERLYRKTYWPVWSVISWVAFRDPAKMGRLDYQNDILKLKLYSDAWPEAVDRLPVETVLAALQAGELTGFRDGADLSRHVWATGWLEKMDDVRFLREDVMRSWPAAPASLGEGNTNHIAALIEAGETDEQISKTPRGNVTAAQVAALRKDPATVERYRIWRAEIRKCEAEAKRLRTECQLPTTRQPLPPGQSVPVWQAVLWLATAKPRKRFEQGESRNFIKRAKSKRLNTIERLERRINNRCPDHWHDLPLEANEFWMRINKAATELLDKARDCGLKIYGVLYEIDERTHKHVKKGNQTIEIPISYLMGKVAIWPSKNAIRFDYGQSMAVDTPEYHELVVRRGDLEEHWPSVAATTRRPPVSRAPDPITPLRGSRQPANPPRPLTSPANWEVWRQRLTAELWQAVALSLDIEPDAALATLDLSLAELGKHNLPADFRNRLETACDHAEAGKLPRVDRPPVLNILYSKVELSAFADWAAGLGWPLPEGFSGAVRKSVPPGKRRSSIDPPPASSSLDDRGSRERPPCNYKPKPYVPTIVGYLAQLKIQQGDQWLGMQSAGAFETMIRTKFAPDPAKNKKGIRLPGRTRLMEIVDNWLSEQGLPRKKRQRRRA